MGDRQQEELSAHVASAEVLAPLTRSCDCADVMTFLCFPFVRPDNGLILRGGVLTVVGGLDEKMPGTRQAFRHNLPPSDVAHALRESPLGTWPLGQGRSEYRPLLFSRQKSRGPCLTLQQAQPPQSSRLLESQ